MPLANFTKGFDRNFGGYFETKSGANLGCLRLLFLCRRLMTSFSYLMFVMKMNEEDGYINTEVEQILL